MLVLSRKVGETIVIGDHITIVVNKVTGNRISLGIEAPPDVRIVRGELAAAARAFRDGASASDSNSVVRAPTFDLAPDSVVHRAR